MKRTRQIIRKWKRSRAAQKEANPEIGLVVANEHQLPQAPFTAKLVVPQNDRDELLSA